MSNIVYTPDQIKEILKPVFRIHNVRRAILFGSYSKGDAGEQSDVDIFVESGLKGLAFFGLLEDVVTSLGKQVDLLDASEIIPQSPIDMEIKKHGVVIYGK